MVQSECHVLYKPINLRGTGAGNGFFLFCGNSQWTRCEGCAERELMLCPEYILLSTYRSVSLISLHQ